MTLVSQKAAQMGSDKALLSEACVSLMNEGGLTTTDKVASALPYLLPLLDGLQFGRFLLAENSDNPVVGNQWIVGLLGSQLFVIQSKSRETGSVKHAASHFRRHCSFSSVIANRIGDTYWI
jgi:hypothetical protein